MGARRRKIFDSRILRRILEPKRNENGEWRVLHNEELHTLYRSPIYSKGGKIYKIEMGIARSQNGRR